MEVLLIKDVKDIGNAGEIVNVSDGHARNFLIPKKLAKPATPQIIEETKQKKEKQAKIAEMDLAKTEELARKLDGYEIEVTAKASDEGTLFGSITQSKISNLLKEKGFDIDKDQISAEHIKEVGEHEVLINLQHGLEAKIILIVSAIG